MPETNNNGNNRPPKKQYNKNKTRNNGNQNQQPSSEFNSYCDAVTYSSYYFGLNILDIYKPEQLVALVRDPMGNSKMLRELSLMLYGTNGAFTHTTDFMKALPIMEGVVVAHGDSKQKKKRNKELMESTLRKIKHKELARDVIFKDAVEGGCYYYFETTERPLSNKKTMSDIDVMNITEINEIGVNAFVHTLPADYTRIVGFQNNYYVIAFNLDYFTNNSFKNIEKELRKWPKEIRDAWNKRKSSKSGDNWVVLDNTKTIVCKVRAKREELYGRPLVLSAIRDILYKDYFTDTKRGVLDDLNNRLILQMFPEGQQKGTSMLTKQQQEAQHRTVKEAVLQKNNKGGSTVISLAPGTKISTIDTQNTDIFDEKNEGNIDNSISLGLGFPTGLINGVSSGTYSIFDLCLKLISAEVFEWLEQFANELNKCISENIIKDNKNWVEFKYLPLTYVNKNEMVGYAKELYLEGRGSLSLWAAACGISPDVFFALLDQEKEANIEELYKPHATSYNTSGNNTGGRPTTDNPTDNTVKSRANDGNALPSPSDN